MRIEADKELEVDCIQVTMQAWVAKNRMRIPVPENPRIPGAGSSARG